MQKMFNVKKREILAAITPKIFENKRAQIV